MLIFNFLNSKNEKILTFKNRKKRIYLSVFSRKIRH